MSPLEAVLFDLGDTLVDLGEGRGTYEQRLIARAGYVYDVLTAADASLRGRETFCNALATDSEAQYHAALAEQRGIDIYTIMRRFFEREGIPANDELVDAGSDAYCAGKAEVPTPLRPGAREVLAELRSWGLRMGAISNTIQPARYMNRTMISRGLAEFFEVQVYSSEVGVAKPHPAIFRAALDALGVAAEGAVYVGDRLHTDVAGAEGVEMKGVLIEVAHRVEYDPAVVPDARISELPELPGVLSPWRR